MEGPSPSGIRQDDGFGNPGDCTMIGHSRQCGELLRDLAQETLTHAYLFTGKRHLGKFTIAKWFAHRLLTRHLAEEERERAEYLIKKNMHPDLLVLDQLWIEDVCTDWSVIAKFSNISQEHRAKRKAKTDTISIDDIRELQRRLHETPEGLHLCCLIRSMERLNIEACNALLKILEEPPPRVLFLCTTENPRLLPLTILSRMRIIQFFPLPASALVPLLQNFPEEDRLLMLQMARGAPGVLSRALENPELLRNFRQAYLDAERFLGVASPVERLTLLQKALEEDGGSLFLEQLGFLLREQLRSQQETAAAKADAGLVHYFRLLHALESNTQRPLLALQAALQFSALPA